MSNNEDVATPLIDAVAAACDEIAADDLQNAIAGTAIGMLVGVALGMSPADRLLLAALVSAEIANASESEAVN